MVLPLWRFNPGMEAVGDILPLRSLIRK